MEFREMARFAAWGLVAGLVAFAAATGCTVAYSDGSDDDDTSDVTVDSTTLEIFEGTGFDMDTRAMVVNVSQYNELTNDDQLVYPSAWACGDPDQFNEPATVPAVCGDLYHFNPFKQYDSFEDAYADLVDTAKSSLEKSYFFWSVESSTDVHWGVVLADGDQNEYVFFLNGLTDDGALQFEFAPIE